MARRTWSWHVPAPHRCALQYCSDSGGRGFGHDRSPQAWSSHHRPAPDSWSSGRTRLSHCVPVMVVARQRGRWSGKDFCSQVSTWLRGEGTGDARGRGQGDGYEISRDRGSWEVWIEWHSKQAGQADRPRVALTRLALGIILHIAIRARRDIDPLAAALDGAVLVILAAGAPGGGGPCAPLDEA